MNLLDQRQVTSPAIKWGIELESEALKAFLHVGVSPDGGVYDRSNIGEPYGFAEVKCPFKHCDRTPQQACQNSFTYCKVAY